MFFEKDAGPQNGIPFFPAYDYENVNGVSVWWFEREFSQGQYGKHAHRGTNSCTLITVLTAQKIAQGRIKVSCSLLFTEPLIDGVCIVFILKLRK